MLLIPKLWLKLIYLQRWIWPETLGVDFSASTLSFTEIICTAIFLEGCMDPSR